MASFFDAIGNLFTPQNMAAAAVIGIPTLIAADMSSKANVKAAQIAADAANRQAEAIAAGNDMAQQRFQTLQDQTAPGVSHLRTVVSAPTGLTPDQIAAQEELRRQSTNQISRSGLRGSGRATTTLIKTVDTDFVNKALAANRGRQDAAAGALATPGLASYGQQAGVDQNTGKAIGAAEMTGGLAAAGAETANAQLQGRALGDIASVIASDIKGRESRYEKQRKEADLGGTV